MEKKRSHLQEWALAHEPSETLIYKRGYWEQIVFVRDWIPEVLAKTYEEYEAIMSNMKAISTHTSKSVLLPVFRVELADGTVFTMRYNFYDWKMSVDSPRDVDADFMGLFNPDATFSSCYCEGFPEECVYGSYAKNKRRFTIELAPGEHRIFAFFWIFSHQVLGNRNKGGGGR